MIWTKDIFMEILNKTVITDDKQFQTLFGEPFQCYGYLFPKHKDAKMFVKHLIPAMLVFIR